MESTAQTNTAILLAEDDDNDVFFVQAAFAKAGLVGPLKIAQDGQQAIAYLAGEGIYADRHHYPSPGLLLLDLSMPFRTGFDVLNGSSSSPCPDARW
jgi:CheY-like chemotaxis protein